MITEFNSQQQKLSINKITQQTKKERRNSIPINESMGLVRGDFTVKDVETANT